MFVDKVLHFGHVIYTTGHLPYEGFSIAAHLPGCMSIIPKYHMQVQNNNPTIDSLQYIYRGHLVHPLP
jgi:hypothetical protein